MNETTEHLHEPYLEQCWICDKVFCNLCHPHCPECGDPQEWGPTLEEEKEAHRNYTRVRTARRYLSRLFLWFLVAIMVLAGRPAMAAFTPGNHDSVRANNNWPTLNVDTTGAKAVVFQIIYYIGGGSGCVTASNQQIPLRPHDNLNPDESWALLGEVRNGTLAMSNWIGSGSGFVFGNDTFVPTPLSYGCYNSFSVTAWNSDAAPTAPGIPQVGLPQTATPGSAVSSIQAGANPGGALVLSFLATGLGNCNNNCGYAIDSGFTPIEKMDESGSAQGGAVAWRAAAPATNPTWTWGNMAPGMAMGMNVTLREVFATGATLVVVTAATCELGELQQDLSYVARDGTLNVPAGNCTWPSTLNLTRGVKVLSPGPGSETARPTSIIFGTSGVGIAVLPDQANDTFKIDGFSFDGNNQTRVLLQVQVGTRTNIIITHNTFKNAGFAGSPSATLYLRGQIRGVIGNNLFDRVATLGQYMGAGTLAEWQGVQPSLKFGLADQLFFETNKIKYSSSFPNTGFNGWFETGQGARAVIRFNDYDFSNTVDAEQFDIHGFQNWKFLCREPPNQYPVTAPNLCNPGDGVGQPSPGQTGTQIYENYDNHVVSSSAPRWMYHRGSMGIFFDNTFQGQAASTVGNNVGQYDLFSDGGSGCAAVVAAVSGLSLPLDFIPEINNTYFFHNIANPQSTQREVPAGRNLTSNCGMTENGTGSYPLGYWNLNSSFNGTAGVGRGTANPATAFPTCTIGVGYWKTNAGNWRTDDEHVDNGDGEFWQCTATNTWTQTYTPYTYPHPFASGNVVPPSPTDPYWTSPTGTATWTGCHSATPLNNAAACSLATANANAQPGNTVMMRAGPYTANGTNTECNHPIQTNNCPSYGTPIWPANSGTATAPITYRAYSGDAPNQPVLMNVPYQTGSYAYPYANGAGIILHGSDFQPRSYIVVDGVRGTNLYSFIDMASATHDVVENSTYIGLTVGSSQLHIAVWMSAQYNILRHNIVGEIGGFLNDRVHCVYPWNATNPNNNNSPYCFSYGHVMQVGLETMSGVSMCPSGQFCDDTAYNLFDGNTFYHGGHDVFSVAGHHNIFKNNFIHNEPWADCARPEANYRCGQRGVNVVGDGAPNNHNVFSGNIFGGSGLGEAEGGQPAVTNRSTGDTIFRNNLFYYTSGWAADLYTAYYYMVPQRNYYYHNVFFHNGVNALADALQVGIGRGVGFNWMGSGVGVAPTQDNVFKNNIFYQNAAGTYMGRLGSFFFANPDDFFSQTFSGNLEQKAQDRDPLWVNIAEGPNTPPNDFSNPNAFDFHLQPGSPAIDFGSFLTTTTSAGTGTVIPVEDANYFIDGYGIDTPDTIQLEGQPPVHIVSIDYTANLLTVDTSLTWAANAGVSLPYKGNFPDAGAFESNDTAPAGNMRYRASHSAVSRTSNLNNGFPDYDKMNIQLDTSDSNIVIFAIAGITDCTYRPTDTLGNTWSLIHQQIHPNTLTMWYYGAWGSSLITGPDRFLLTDDTPNDNCAGFPSFVVTALHSDHPITSVSPLVDQASGNVSASPTASAGSPVSGGDITLSTIVTSRPGVMTGISDGFTIVDRRSGSSVNQGIGVAYKVTPGSTNPVWTMAVTDEAIVSNLSLKVDGPAPPTTPITFVQSWSGQSTQPTSVYLSVSIPVPSGGLPGNVLIAHLVYYSGGGCLGPVNVSDSQGNLWTVIAGGFGHPNGVVTRWYMADPNLYNKGTTVNISATPNCVSYSSVAVALLNSPTLPVTVVDSSFNPVTLQAVNQPGPVSGGSITFAGIGTSINGNTGTIDSGYTLTDMRGAVAFAQGIGLAYKVTPGAGTNPTWTMNSPDSFMASNVSLFATPTIDTIPPTVTITAPAPNTNVPFGSTLYMAATATDNIGVASVQFTLDGVNIGSPRTTPPYTLNYTVGLPLGARSLGAYALDTSGNRGDATPVSINVVDTVPPTITLTSPTPGANINFGGTLNLAASATDNVAVAYVQFQLDGINIGPQITSPPYQFTYGLGTTPTGPHTAGAYAVDTSNNHSAPVTVSFNIVDTVLPTITITSPPNNTLLQTNMTLNATATASHSSGIAAVQFTLDGANIGPAVTTPPYHIAYALAGTPPGHHSLGAFAMSTSGVRGDATPVSLTIADTDITPPTITITAPQAGSEQFGVIPVLAANATDNVGMQSVQFAIDGVNRGPLLRDPPYEFLRPFIFDLAPGTHTISATAWDTSNNSTTTSINFTVVEPGIDKLNVRRLTATTLHGGNTTGNGNVLVTLSY